MTTTELFHKAREVADKTYATKPIENPESLAHLLYAFACYAVVEQGGCLRKATAHGAQSSEEAL